MFTRPTEHTMPKIKTHAPGASSAHLADPHGTVKSTTAPHAGMSRHGGGQFRQGSSHMTCGGDDEHGEAMVRKHMGRRSRDTDDGGGWL
jgi:hypothetical protein